jgi:hypothetical protein
MEQIEIIITMNTQLFLIMLTEEKVASIISQDFIDGSDGTGRDHCGTGKERKIYTIIEAYPIELKNEEIYEETKAETKLEETKAEPQTNTVKIQYSGNVLNFEIQPNETIGEIKLKLLKQLGFNESEYKVRIIFLGQIRENNVLLSELGSGITLQAQVNKIPTGGRRTKKNRRKKSVTRKRNIRRKKTKKR